jgi:predicted transcriptional regulator
MPAKKPVKIKPTTMRIPPDLLTRAGKVATQRYQRSRSWLINHYIEKGLERDERKPQTAGKGAFA